MTARVKDANGWFEVPRNPLSKEGVFPYLGRQLGLTGADATKLFNVYRPGSELADPETIDSFRLLPMIDDHTMLGAPEAGRTPAEKKGVHGVIGDRVVFEGGTLYGNLKLFSQSLAQKINAGKRELSCGYSCTYDFTPGVFDGKAYDAVQRRLRGNHVALVDKGRMGPDVAVLDQMTFTVDAEDLRPMDKTLEAARKALEAAKAAGATQAVIDACDAAVKEAEASVAANGNDALTAAQKAATDAQTAADAATKEAADAKEALAKMTKEADDAKTALAAATKEGGAAADAADVATLKTTVATLTDELKTLKEAGNGMDEATMFAAVAQRDALAKRLSPFIGVFDHADKTLTQVAAYGIEKLGLKNVTAGHELTALDAYLAGAKVPTAINAEDGGAPKESAVTRYLAPAAG